MQTRTTAITTATLAVIVAVLTGCSTPTTPAPSISASIATAPATSAPGATPAPTFTTAVATDAPVGTTIPSDQVKAAKDAGMHVYVSPTGDGTGIVLQPGQPIPDQVVADNRAATPTQMPATMAESVAGGKTATASRAAITDAGLPVVFVYTIGEWGADGHLMNTLWGVAVQNVPDHDAINQGIGQAGPITSHAAAQAKAQALASQYGAQVIDAG